MGWVRDVSIFFQVVLYIMGSVAALAAGVAALVKLWKWARKPHEETNASLEAHKLAAASENKRLQAAIEANQKSIEKIFTLLEKDRRRLDKNEENFKVLYKGIWVMLDHKITGNSDEKMRSIRDELQAHIINT